MTNPIALDKFQRPEKERKRNERDAEEPCFCCGRDTDGSRWIRLDETCGWIIPANDPAETDGGWFPVGPECAKKLPAGFVSAEILT